LNQIMCEHCGKETRHSINMKTVECEVCGYFRVIMTMQFPPTHPKEPRPTEDQGVLKLRDTDEDVVSWLRDTDDIVVPAAPIKRPVPKGLYYRRSVKKVWK
jgi:DNA-directed RNA polymerase subunit RPC12/RpoP